VYVPDAAPQVEGSEIVEPLGEGGMGTVSGAVQLSTRREVALKILRTGAFGSEKARTRFEREVEFSAHRRAHSPFTEPGESRNSSRARPDSSGDKCRPRPEQGWRIPPAETVIYYASIAGALVFHQEKITQHSYGKLQEAYADLEQKKWIPSDLKDLFKREKAVCRQQKGKVE